MTNRNPKPILFNGAMVRAILQGRKTQTRRMMNRLKGIGPISEFGISNTFRHNFQFRDKQMTWHDVDEQYVLKRYPWSVGDILYVRENVRGIAVESMGTVDGVEYLAEHSKIPLCRFDTTEYEWLKLYDYGKGPDVSKIVPSIHMPKWAARLFLPVISVRSERLQDITEEDAKKEGVIYEPCPTDPNWSMAYTFEGIDYHYGSAREAFATYWDLLAEAGFKWDDNPWVWRIEFKVQS